MLLYATAQDYGLWLDDSSQTVALGVLRAASADIDELLFSAVYDTNEDGTPSDEAVAEVLKEATCAQVQFLLEAGDTTGTGTVGKVKTASLGSASYQFEGSGLAAAGATTRTGRPIASQALSILRTARILTTVSVRG